MSSARRTEAAERDLREIAFQVAFTDNRPLTADRIIDELIEQADTLARLSESSVIDVFYSRGLLGSSSRRG